MFDRKESTAKFEAEEKRMLSSTLDELRDELHCNLNQCSLIRESFGLDEDTPIDHIDWSTKERITNATKIAELILLLMNQQDLNRHIRFKEEKEVDIVNFE